MNQATVELKKHLDFPSLRWVPMDKVHLTLRFFGNASEKDYELIKAALHATALIEKPSQTTIGHLGAFPSLSKPNVIWIGLQPDEYLEHLNATLNAKLHDYGFPPEGRSFSPHITVARVSQQIKPGEKQLLSKKLNQIDLANLGENKFAEIHLFKSTFQQGNYVYSVLVSEKLVG